MGCIHDLQAVEEYRRRHRLDPAMIRQLHKGFYKQRLDAEEAVSRLPEGAREDALRSFSFHALELESAHDSQDDGATKLIFRTSDGIRLESVILRIQTGRVSLCVSSQAGCRAACSFCATGTMGLKRNLTAAEIIDQVIQSNQRLRSEDRAVRNIVFMGMGEPLHNTDEVLTALDRLTATGGLHHPASRILVSTVGIPDQMMRLHESFPNIRQALSLHAALPDVRKSIVPLARRYSLDELRQTVASINESGHQVMVEYILLSGVNDREEDVDALIEWCRGLSVHINLIPYNRVEGIDLEGTLKPRRVEIATRLREATPHSVTTRHSMGTDIAAACGQLVKQQNQALD